MEEEKLSKRPKDTAFTQQRLPAWQPLLTPMWVIFTFAIVGVAFLPIGVWITISSNGVVELSQRYDLLCGGNPSTPGGSSTCTVTMTVTEEMKPPIYVYYELENYYQNHRRYVKSRSDEQLRGKLTSSIANCDPIEKDATGKIIVACGLISNSFFNDTFSVSQCPGTGGNCSLLTGDSFLQTGIAWKTDVEDKFKYATPDPATMTTNSSSGFPLPRVDNEHFIVWMRTAGLPSFRKLYARNEATTLRKGDVVSVNIVNQYPVASFDGKKYVVLSTTSSLGGKNAFLGWAYIVVGVLSILFALVFTLKKSISPRTLGDMSYFDWAGGPSRGSQDE